MKVTTWFLAIVVILAAPTQVLAVKIYKWIDDKGTTHYSGQKPYNVVALPFNPSFKQTYGTPSYSEEEPANNAGTEQAGGDTDDMTKKEDEKPKLSAKKRREMCQRARSNRFVIESKNQIRERDAKGNTRYLPEAERQARLTKMRKLEKEHCS